MDAKDPIEQSSSPMLPPGSADCVEPCEAYLGMPAVYRSEAMRELMSVVVRVARSNAAVLITGESGVGKELIARALHHHSLRCSKPWVDVNCAALPEHLIESELFGYEKGAFSGAQGPKQGLFELADSGTLFLDEVGELEPRIQVKLLRVLDGVPYFRLGGLRNVTVDSRIVTATNQDLERAIQGANSAAICIIVSPKFAFMFRRCGKGARTYCPSRGSSSTNTILACASPLQRKKR